MTTPARNIIFNVDVEDDIFAQFASPSVAGLPRTKGLADAPADAQALAEALKCQAATVWLFLRRQTDHTSRLVAASANRLAEVGRAMYNLQVSRHAAAIHIVDCSERPADPLSDFGVLALYLEAIGAELSDETPSVIYALDYDVMPDANEGLSDVRFWDTRDPAFEDHAAACYRAAIRSLNAGFGSGPLPDVPHKSGLKQSGG